MKICSIIATLSILMLTHCTINEVPSKIKILETPNDGIQPRVKVDQTGQVHLIYYKGSSQAGDLFYTRKLQDGTFTDPLMVNSIQGSAISVGTIRGAQFAIDTENRIHVVWNSSVDTKPDSLFGPPMYYTRLRDDNNGFEPQQIISGDWPVDGGGAIATGKNGLVYVFWHSVAKGFGEKDRKVFLRVSNDSGERFGNEKVISPEGTGVCGCCSMQASSDNDGKIYVVYRTATNSENRDINLLVSNDEGMTFQDKILDRWKLKACPMSSMSFGELDDSMLVGWETEQQVRMTRVDKGSVNNGEILSLSEKSKGGKHPVFASSPNGYFLVAWTEGTGWEQGGAIAWQLYDPKMNPASEVGSLPATVSVWSFASAYYDHGEDTFYIFH